VYVFQFRALRCLLTGLVFSARSEGFLESAETLAESRERESNAALYGDDSYVDFTSYSDGTDPYPFYSSTELSIGNPSGTLLSSDLEESPRITFLQEPMLMPHVTRTQEWVRAQQLDSPTVLPRRRPGVTFEESPIVHIVAPPSTGTCTLASEDSYDFLAG